MGVGASRGFGGATKLLPELKALVLHSLFPLLYFGWFLFFKAASESSLDPRIALNVFGEQRADCELA